MCRKLNIALVSAYDYALPSGVNNHIENLGAQLKSKGHTITIFAPCSNVIPEKHFVPISNAIAIPTNGSIARISLSLSSFPKVKKILNQSNFDIVHLHEPFAGLVPLAFLQYSKSVNIATFHSLRNSTFNTVFKHIKGAKLVSKYYKKLDGRITISKASENFISDHFEGEFEIIPNGINLQQFSKTLPPIKEIQDGMTNILFVGRMEKRKGLKYLLSAYGKLKWDWPNIRLIVLGSGELDKETTQLIASRNLGDVIFVNHVTNSIKMRYFKTCDIFCSPATGNESFGIVLLEAMASGKPIIASDIPGYKTVLENNKQGILVPPKNESAIASSILRLLENPLLRNELGGNGIARAREYDWEIIGNKINNYYNQILTSKAG